jgi:YD repeat-containing protein
MNVKKLGLAAMVAGSVLTASAAWAQETTDYTYDALGRLTKVVKTGGPSSGVQANYSYDAASNRTNVTVTNSPNGSGNGDSGGGASVPDAGPMFVVLPLNGFTVIPVN